MGRLRLKFCGMTRQQDIQSAIGLGVDAFGLIFYPQSSRYISIEQAKLLLSDLPPFVDVVAVMVNPDKTMVDTILHELPLQILQFHGQESPEFCEQFRFPYIKAFPAKSSQDILDCEQRYPSASAILLDTPSTIAHGGTGQAFDWQLIPDTLNKPYILAGGLDAINVKNALRELRPFALDVCSGIESSPGIKDIEKMKHFVKAMRDNDDRH